MSFGFSVGDVLHCVQFASSILKSFSHYRTGSEDFKLLLSEITNLRTTLLAVEEVLSSDSQALLQNISFLERAVSDHETKLQQALEVSERYGNMAWKEGRRFKDRLKNGVWEEMERLREDIPRLREETERFQKDLGSHTSESPILVEGRFDCLFTVRADHQCNPITHGMRNPCTAIVLAPNRLNTHMSSDKGFCDTFIKTILNGDLFPIPVTCLATLHKNVDPLRDFVKHLMIPCKTTTHPRPASGTETLCWERHAKSESRTCSQHPAFSSSKLERFLHRVRKALPLNTSSPVILLSPLLFAPSVRAFSPGCVSTHDRVSWAQALRSTQTDLISLWTHPLSLSPPPEPATNPTTILLATFLSTTAIALAAQAGKNDAYQPHIVGFCALVSAIWATGLGVGVREFVFGYLFWACAAGVGGSWVIHRAMAAGKARWGFVGKVEREGEMKGI